MKHVWGKEQSNVGFWSERFRKRDHLEDPGVDGSIILKFIFEKLDGRVNWIRLAQDRERWRAVVNAVMNCRVP
jgi:hypothetical protein